MSTSIFKRKNKQVVGAYIDRLIGNYTALGQDDENFEIAQRFIWNKFENNSFADTNENVVERQFKKLQEKLMIHSQDERANRLKYLHKEFKKRKTFKQVGISDTHACLLQLLMCLSVNPTGAGQRENLDEEEGAGGEDAGQDLLAGKFQDYGIGGVNDDLPSTKLYPDRELIERLNQEKFENDLKELQNGAEMQQIKMVKRQWERELQAEEGDSSSYYEEDDRGTDSLEDELDEQKQVNSFNYSKDHEMQDQSRIKPKRSKRPVRIFKDEQVLFGGLPVTNEIKVPVIKSVNSLKFKRRTGRSQAVAPKKFSLNQFLDQFLDQQQSQQDQKVDEQEKLAQEEKSEEFRIQNQKIQDQYDLKNLLNIRTFDEIQNHLSDRLLTYKNAKLANPLLTDHGASQLYKDRSCMVEPMNLNRDLNKALNPYSMVNKSSHLLTTERRLVLDILQMLTQPSLESDTFVRDGEQLGVLFKLRHDGKGFTSAATLSHLSQGATHNVLNKFLQMGNDLQKTCFFFRGIQTNSERLSTVIQSLIFAFNKILDRFNYEMSDLTQILLLQAGQISKSQIALSPLSLSRVTVAFPQYMEVPLTLMKLEHILDQQGLFSKITALKGIMEKGILDYVAHCHSVEAQRQIEDNEFLIERMMNNQQKQGRDLMDSFLKLADNFDDDKKNDQIEEQDGQEGQDENEQYQRHSKLENAVNNTQNLPNARLNFEYIKPADRATYLLNYLYLQIQSDQLLLDNFQGLGNERLNTLKECFLTCLKPYLEILNDWVCKGDDDLSTHDLKNEFFIKANHRLFVGQVTDEENQNIHSQNSRKQWSESYVFRTINISKLLGRAMRGKAKGAGGAMDNLVNMLDQNNDGNEDDEILNKKAARDHVEISCPIFLRPLMKQILSVGKSIKIVRYLENIDMYKAKSKSNTIEADSESAQIQDTLDHQGIDYEKLSQHNVKQIKTVINQVQSDLDALEKARREPIDYMNANRDMPSFQIETIAKNFINHESQQKAGMDESASLRHQQEQLLQIAPFQMTHQYENPARENGEEDVEMRDDKEKGDILSKLRKDSQIEQIDPQFFGLFKMPQVIKSYEANEANDQYHDEIKKQTQDKVQQIASQQTVYHQLNGGIVGQETEWKNRIVGGANGGTGSSNCSTDENSPKDDKLIVFGNKKPASSLVIGDKCKKIESLQKQEFFDFAQQELSIYDKSMRQYQSKNAFQYYLSDQENKGSNMQNGLSSNLPFQLSFRHLTLETYLYDSILMPIQGIFQSTSQLFMSKYLMSPTPQYCQLQDQLSLLHKVYFLQGVAMQKFLGGLFDKIDESINHQSTMANQLYLINGNFQECLAEILSGHSLRNLNMRNIKANMNVEVEDGPGAGAAGLQRKSKQHARSSDFLQSIKVVYNCEWPIEVVIDKLTIVNKYNRIFKLLIHIKFAKYLMQKRDYHIREPNLLKTTKHYTYAKNYEQQIEDMGARERLVLQNKVMLGQLMFQLQMFQGELLHFITTMEDYFMNRATHLECRKLLQEINKMKGQGLQQDKSAQQQPASESTISIEPVIDLDDIIDKHDSYIGRILQLCLLDTKSQELLRYILEIVDICQDFRKLIKYYLLSDDFDQASDDDGENYGGADDSYDASDPAAPKKSRSSKIEDKFTGMGLLNINSGNFVQNVEECSEKLNQMRTQFEKHMLVLTTNLNKLTKTQSGKIILNYLLEILQRLNFNSYYVSRENEGLPPVGYYN